jgi:hypothetical protein
MPREFFDGDHEAENASYELNAPFDYASEANYGLGDGPDYDFEGEQLSNEYEEIKDTLDGLTFEQWVAEENRRCYLPQPERDYSYPSF